MPTVTTRLDQVSTVFDYHFVIVCFDSSPPLSLQRKLFSHETSLSNVSIMDAWVVFIDIQIPCRPLPRQIEFWSNGYHQWFSDQGMND